MLAYLETLFRCKRFFLIPIILIPLLTLFVTYNTTQHYTIRSTVWTDTTRLLPAEGGRAPNITGARLINDRLRTAAFRKKVMDASGLTDAIQAGVWPEPTRLQTFFANNAVLRQIGRPLGLTLPESPGAGAAMASGMIGRSVKATAVGSNLIFITYAGSNPALGQRLIEETIKIHQNESLAKRMREAEVGEDYLTRQLNALEDRVFESTAKLASFEGEYPSPPLGIQRQGEELEELQRLQQIRSLDEARYLQAQNTLEDLRRRSDESLSTADLRFGVVDPPVGGGASSRVSRRKLGMMGVMGVTLGTMLGTVSIVLITWRNRTVRTKADVESVIETPVIIEIPDLRPFGRDPSLVIRNSYGIDAAPPGRQLNEGAGV